MVDVNIVCLGSIETLKMKAKRFPHSLNSIRVRDNLVLRAIFIGLSITCLALSILIRITYKSSINKYRIKMKKKFNTIIMLLLIAIAVYAQHTPRIVNDFKEGDLIFQVSQSNQSPFIQLATNSPWSHCGVIVEKGGKVYVLEASNVVKLTPLKKWISRGKFGKYKRRRVLNKPVKIRYAKYLGKKYDLAFKFNNNKYYCSELIYDIFKDQFGIQLATPKPIKSYHVFGLGKLMKRRGMDPNQKVVAPCDLL